MILAVSSNLNDSTLEGVEGLRGQDLQEATVCSAQSRWGLRGCFVEAYSFSRKEVEWKHWALLTGGSDRREQHRAAAREGQLDLKKFLPQRAVRHWNRLPRVTASGWPSSRSVQTVLSDTAFEFWVVSCKARSCVSLPTQDALWFCKWEKADISLNMWGCFMNFSNLSNIQLRHSSRKKRSVYHELWRLNYLHTSSWGNE